MSKLEPIGRLVQELARLPGIGERSAARLAYYIIKMSQTHRHVSSLARDLAEALLDVDAHVGLCQQCQNLASAPYCVICADSRRDQSIICVVEGVADLRAIEQSGSFRGAYHVLHGTLAPLDGIGPQDLKIEALLRRLEKPSIREVILATSTHVEGDATALYVANVIRPFGVAITRPASGIPMGGELEYVDQGTLARALAERKAF